MTSEEPQHQAEAADGTAGAAEVLTVIGYWRDASEKYWPDVNDYVDHTWDASARAVVVGRLRAGAAVRQYRGYSTCRMCGRLNGTAELCDGTYLWPEGLAHYISDHGVRLPQPAEEHFLDPRTHRDDQAEVTESDDSWWLSLGNPTWT